MLKYRKLLLYLQLNSVLSRIQTIFYDRSMYKIRIHLVIALIATALMSMAQSAITDIPKTVNYHDARVTNVGVVATDIYQWAVEDSLTHKVDTVFTAEPISFGRATAISSSRQRRDAPVSRACRRRLVTKWTRARKAT